MKFYVLFILTVLITVSCKKEKTEMVLGGPKIEMSAAERSTIEKMLWVDTLDPIKAVAKSVAVGNCQYLAGANRGKVYLPGLDAQASEAIINNKQFTILEGMGDVIRGSAHKEYRTKTKAYMSTYNERLQDSC